MPESTFGGVIANNSHRQRIKHTMDKAEKYTVRKQNKHAAEMALISRAVTQLTPAPLTWLDAPCGVGRASILLSRQGFNVTGVDLGEGALSVAREEVAKQGVDVAIKKADLLQLPYEQRHFGAVLCFRLIHHLPTPEHRLEIIEELCRVAEDYVLISYLSPWSYTSIKRLLRQRLTGRRSVQNVTPLTELDRHFASCGFQRTHDLAQLNMVHSLHLAIYKRTAADT